MSRPVTSQRAQFFRPLSLVLPLALLLGACVTSSTSPPDRAAGPPDASAPAAARVTLRPASEGLPVHGIWKSTPCLADLNADGFPDLAALPRLGEGARVWLSNGRGTWREASEGLKVEGSCGGGIAAADVNRDGHIDLVVADHCDGVFVFAGDGHGRWTPLVTELNPAIGTDRPPSEDEDNPFLGAEDVAVGDVNEDGFLDLVVAASNIGGFAVYLGDGSGRVWKEVTVPDGLPSGIDPDDGDVEATGWAIRVVLADVDGDRHLDLVATYHSGPRVWRGNGAARWERFSRGLPSPSAGGVYRAIALGDVDEDGRLDFVTTSMIAGVEVYLQTTDGRWRRASSPALESLAGGATAAALGDLDGDGHLDLVVGGRPTVRDTAGVFVFLGNGKADWREVRTGLPSSDYPFIWGITVGDVTRDGAPDVVVATGFTAEPLRRPGKPRATQPATTPTSRGPQLQAWINAGPLRQ
jgi:hypothetical protein